jgi:tetratricopeptide (TPR) repeat protein
VNTTQRLILRPTTPINWTINRNFSTFLNLHQQQQQQQHDHVLSTHEYINTVSTTFSSKLNQFDDEISTSPSISYLHQAKQFIQQGKFGEALIQLHLAAVFCDSGIAMSRVYRVSAQLIQYLVDGNQEIELRDIHQSKITDFESACLRLTRLRLKIAEESEDTQTIQLDVGHLFEFCDNNKANANINNLRALVHVFKGISLSKNNAGYAEMAFSQAIQCKSDLVVAYILRGEAKLAADTSNPEPALDDLNRAADLDPKNPLCYARRGAALASLGRITAQLDFEYAISLDSTDPLVYLLRADMYAQSETTVHNAIDDYATAISLNPNNSTAYYERAHLLSNFDDKLEQAMEDVNSMLKINPYNPDAYYLKAIIEEKQNNYLYARGSIDKVIQLEKEYPLIWEYRGKLNYDSIKDNEAAEMDFKQAINSGSFTFQSPLYLGRIIAERDTEEAIRLFTEAIRLEPDDPIAYTMRGYIYLSNDEDSEAALEDYNRTIELRRRKELPLFPELLIYHSDALMKVGQIKSAVKQLESVLEDPQLTLKEKQLCQLHLALGYARDNRVDESMELYGKAAELDPTNASVYFSRALTYRQNDNFEGAIADLTKAIELKGKDFDQVYFFERGLSYLMNNEVENAIKDFDTAILLEEDFIEAYAQRANAYVEQQRYSEAIQDLTRVHELDPEDPLALVQRARIYFNLGDPSKAISDFTAAHELSPYDPVILADRARVYAESLNEMKKAIADINSALSIDTEFADAYMFRARYYRSQKDLTRALADINKAIDINPNHSEAFYERALIFKENKQYKDAIENLDNSISITPDSQSYSARATLNALHLEQREDALKDLDKALEYNPDNTEALNLKSIILMYSVSNDSIANRSEALELANRSISIERHQAIPYVVRFTILDNTQRREEAKEDLQYLQEHFPQVYQQVLVSAKESFQDFTRQFIDEDDEE